jgi:hypothetical protein
MFPNESAIARLIGAILREQNGEYAMGKRYRSLESPETMSENRTLRERTL